MRPRRGDPAIVWRRNGPSLARVEAVRPGPIYLLSDGTARVQPELLERAGIYERATKRDEGLR